MSVWDGLRLSAGVCVMCVGAGVCALLREAQFMTDEQKSEWISNVSGLRVRACYMCRV